MNIKLKKRNNTIIEKEIWIFFFIEIKNIIQCDFSLKKNCDQKNIRPKLKFHFEKKKIRIAA